MREQESGGGLDLSYYFHLLLRYLWLFLTIVGVVLLIALIWALQQPRFYVAKAILQVETQEQKVLQTDDVQGVKLESADYLSTVVETLKSNSLLVRVARVSGLLDDPTYFAPRAEPYTDAEISGRLRGQVATELRRGTRLIDITVKDTNPDRAKLIAETLVREFLRGVLEQRLALSRVANDFLRSESEKLKKKVQESEQKLQQYKEKHNAVSLENTQNITVEKLKELNSQVTAAKSQRIRLEADIGQLRDIPANDLDRLTQIQSVAAIPQVEGLRGQIVTAETELAGVRQKYLPQHPKYIQAETQIKQLKDSLRNTLKDSGRILTTQYQGAKETETKLNEALKEQEQAALELNKIAIPYNVLLQEVESDRAMYDAVNTRLRETSVAMGIEKSPFRVVEEPMTPSVASRGTMKVLAIALFMGVALGAATIFGLDMLDSSLRYVDQAESFLKLPVLAVVSDVPTTGDTVTNVFADTANTQRAEAFRSMRTSLSLLGDEARRKVFLVTSAVPGEGKTFAAYNAAMAFALEGQKTILVDADLRRPSVHKIFPDSRAARKQTGLADYLAGNAEIEKVIMRGPQENLDVICAGNRPPNPGELLSGQAFAKMVRFLSEKYARVIIDSAPVNAVSDTLRVTPLADYVCLVVQAGKTPKKAIERARKLIDKANGKIAGFLLNRVNLGRGSAYYFYHYDYADESEASSASNSSSKTSKGSS